MRSPSGSPTPRFGDEPLNARAVEAAGAGLVVGDPDRIGETVAALLTDPRYAGVATAIAVEVDSLPPAGEAIGLLELERANAVVV